MIGLFTGIILFLIVTVVLAFLPVLTGKRGLEDRNKITPFECGFEPFDKPRSPFSLRFFIITLIFLVFDVEIALILPIGLIYSRQSTLPLVGVSTIILIILTVGLVYEWAQGALQWAV